MSFNKASVAVACASAAAFLLFAGSVTAGADTGATEGPSLGGELISEADLVAGAEIRPLEGVSDCNFNLDWPHKSGHVPGNVTSNGVINCNSKKKYLGVETYLYREVNPGYFKLVAQNSAVDNSGRGSYVNAAAALGCVNARYRATAEFLMVEGNDARHERSHVTPNVSVTC